MSRQLLKRHDVRVRQRAASGRRGRQKTPWSNPGTITVTPSRLVFRTRWEAGHWRPGDASVEVLREDIRSLVASWRPVLRGGGRLQFSNGTWVFEFQFVRYRYANTARRLLTSDPAR